MSRQQDKITDLEKELARQKEACQLQVEHLNQELSQKSKEMTTLLIQYQEISKNEKAKSLRELDFYKTQLHQSHRDNQQLARSLAEWKQSYPQHSELYDLKDKLTDLQT